jgi:MYXO-CTERM domain-containing protein
VNWTAPELPASSDGQLFSVYAVAVDDHGNQVWDFDEIAVYPRAQLNDRQFVRIVPTEDTGGCSAVPSAPGSFLAFLGLGALLLRRRQD